MTGQGAEVLHGNSVEAAEEPIDHDTEQDIQLTDTGQDVRIKRWYREDTEESVCCN
ncbi:hypothetical protein DPMN_154324 [Dreissena polymorpha]|uniref:Uncharacterized protein n=1 Tax=Dreissena polymorpha TaxID=45954 RepID=A0A9D4FQK2_DREPO|nr:hypothetical protein DPMN_154324 [Dreissena polymorpha]